MTVGGVKMTLKDVKRKPLTVRVDADLDTKIEKAAAELGLSKNAFIVMVLHKHYKDVG